MRHIVIGDETLIHHYHPESETKQQSIPVLLAYPSKFKMQTSAGKIM